MVNILSRVQVLTAGVPFEIPHLGTFGRFGIDDSWESRPFLAQISTGSAVGFRVHFLDGSFIRKTFSVQCLCCGVDDPEI